MTAENTHVETKLFPATMAEIQPATDFMVEAIERSGITVDEGTIFELRLTLTEAFANIVDHAYKNASGKTAELTVRICPDELALVFSDSGNRPPPSQLRSRDLEDYQERGLGLFLISRCMDRFEYFFRRDSVNVLKLTRRLIDRPEPPDDDERLPFHVAVYEENEGRTICPIGQYDATRENPFETEFLDGASLVTVELSYLHSIDEPAARALSEYCKASRAGGLNVIVTEPPASVRDALEKLGLAEQVAPRGFLRSLTAVAPDETSESAAEITAAVTRRRRGGGRAYATYMRRLMPARIRGRDVLLTTAMKWRSKTNGMFFRLLEPSFSSDSVVRETTWLIMGCHTEPGWHSITASADIYGLLETLSSAKDRSADYSIRNFMADLAASIAERNPAAYPGMSTLLTVLEFSPNGVTAWSGAGEPIISVGTSPIGAIQLVGDQKLIMRSQGVEGHAIVENGVSRYRVVIGGLNVGAKQALLAAPDISNLSWPQGCEDIDCGLIDVQVIGRGLSQ